MTPTVTATIQPVQPVERTVTLTMPYDVAMSLLSLVGCNVVGPNKGYRGDSAVIYSALRDAGMPMPRYGRFTGYVEGTSRAD